MSDSILQNPAEGAFAITPNDSTDLTEPTRGICFAAAGDLKVDMLNGDTVTFTDGSLAAGAVHPLRVKKVYSTGTTATGIFGVY